MFNIHNHSEYSVQDSISKVKQIALKQKELGSNVFCITDHGTTASFPEAFTIAKELDMIFAPGLEAYLSPKEFYDNKLLVKELEVVNSIIKKKSSTKEEKEKARAKKAILETKPYTKYHHLTLVAYNQEGLDNLFRIYTESEIYYKPRVSLDIVEKYKEGLYVLSACVGGDIGWYLNKGLYEDAKEAALKYKSIFGDKFYAEIMFHDIQDDNLKEVDIYTNKIKLCKELNIPMIPTNDSHYINAEDNSKRTLYRGMWYHKADSNERKEDNSDGNGYHMVSETELRERLFNAYSNLNQEDLDTMFSNLDKIKNSIEKMDIVKSESLMNSDELLEQKVMEGWEKIRKGTKYEEESLERLKYELSIIKSKKFSHYFINTKKIVDAAYCLDLLTGPGRGSGAGSEVVYLLGITKADPLLYGLLFERFLNPSRSAMPDIDIDIESKYIKEDGTVQLGSDAIRDYLSDTFKFQGRIKNVVTSSTLVLFKKLASYIGIPFSDFNKFSTSEQGKEQFALDEKPSKQEFFNVLNILGLTSGIKASMIPLWEELYEKFDICYELDGIVSGSSIHASGVIMSENDVVLPIDQDGYINFNGESLERYEYIKYDMLSLDTLNALNHIYGKDIDWTNVHDDKVWDFICRGELDFVFQLSGGIPRIMAKQGRPRTIEALSEISSINRPGPLNMNLNNIWIDIQNGNYKFEGDDLILANLLKDSFGDHHTGLVIYQEDVMRICVDGAGFSLVEAENVRRAMGKKKQELMESFKEQFLSGWKEIGLGGDEEAIWKKLVDFSKYAFNKSHGIAYSLVSYKIAECIVYHMDEFLEYLINHGSAKNKSAAIVKCNDLGMKIVYPQLGCKEISEYKIEDNKLYVPTVERRKFNYISDFIFSDMTEPEKNEYILHGCLDEVCPDRLGLIQIIKHVPAKKLYNPMFPESNNFKEILDNGVLLELWSYIDEGNCYNITVNKARSKVDVKLYKNKNTMNNENLEFRIKNDLKYLGIIKNNTLSNLPILDLSNGLNRIEIFKNRFLDGRKLEELNRVDRTFLKNNIVDNSFRKFISDPRIKFKIDQIEEQVLTGYFLESKFFKEYGYSKVTIEFNQGEHTFFTRDKNLINKLASLNKKSIVRLKLKLDYYISRKLEIVYSLTINDIF